MNPNRTAYFVILLSFILVAQGYSQCGGKSAGGMGGVLTGPGKNVPPSKPESLLQPDAATLAASQKQADGSVVIDLTSVTEMRKRLQTTPQAAGAVTLDLQAMRERNAQKTTAPVAQPIKVATASTPQQP